MGQDRKGELLFIYFCAFWILHLVHILLVSIQINKFNLIVKNSDSTLLQTDNSFDFFTGDLFLPLRASIAFCIGICNFLSRDLSYTVETFKILRVSVLRRGLYGIIWMEFSMGSVTAVDTMDDRWAWLVKGAGSHQEVAGRAATVIPQHSWCLGLPWKALSGHTVAKASTWKATECLLGRERHFHSFPEQMFLVRKMPW